MKLTRNFSFIDDPIFSIEIEKIENKIINKDWDGVPEKIRNIAENILIKTHGFQGRLNDMIISYKYRYDNPTVIDALHHIKNTGNKFSHNLSSDIKRPIDQTDMLYLIKSLSIICQDAFKNSKEEFEFSDEAYLEPIIEDRKQNKNIVKNIRDKELLISKTTMISWFEDPKYIIKIPFYQRKYSWKPHNVKTLLNDIEERTKDMFQHYFGVIAISKTMDETNDKIILKIIDGQQRITTSLLVLRAAYDSFSNKENIPFQLKNVIENSDIETRYINDAAEDSEISEFIEILKGNLKDNFTTIYYKNYALIKERLSHFKEEKITDLINNFINKFEIADLQYKVDPKREMDIFENMNSKGTDLDEWDLIKNLIFNFVKDGIVPDKDKIIYMRRLFESDFSLNLTDPNEKLSEFFKEFCYLKFTHSELTYKNKYDRFKVYNNFKKLYKNIELNSVDEYKEFLIEIQKYAIIQKAIITNITELAPELSYLQNRIKNITSKPSTYFLIMALVEKCFKWEEDSWLIENTKEFEDAIVLLDSLFIRLEVADGFGHSFREKLIKMVENITSDNFENAADAISKVIFNTENEADSIMPSNSVFKEKLVAPYTFRKKNSLATRILFQLELFMQNKDSGQHYDLKIKNPSLEHVMPKTNDEWASFLRTQLKPDEELEEKFQKHLNMLGNFLVLPKPINSKIKKSIFKKKKIDITKFNVPIIKGDLSLNLSSIESIEEWNFELIEKRTIALSEAIIKFVYPYKIKTSK